MPKFSNAAQISVRAICAIGLILVVAGCAGLRERLPFGNRGDGSGITEKQKEAKDRIAVLPSDQGQNADPELANIEVTIPAAISLASWPNSGGIPTNAPQNLAGDGALSVFWRAKMGAGANKTQALVSKPIIADNKIYTLDAHLTVHASAQANGRRVWSKSIGGVSGSRFKRRGDSDIMGGGIAFDNGQIFATTGFGSVVALNAATGAINWQISLGSPVHAAPFAHSGRVFVVATNSEYFAIDARNGEIQWTQSALPETTRVLTSSSSAIVGDTLVTPFPSGELIASLPANGRKLWSDNLSRTNSGTSLSAINDIAGHPVILDGVVYGASQSGVVVAVDLRTGIRSWQADFGSIQSPWVSGNSVYIVTTESQLICINRETGTIKWIKQLAAFENIRKHKDRITWSGPLMVASRLVLGSSKGQIIEVNPQSGEIVNTISARGQFFIPPISVDGVVYFYSNDGDIVALK
jgi:outer membrane protein assembly factor BamB